MWQRNHTSRLPGVAFAALLFLFASCAAYGQTAPPPNPQSSNPDKPDLGSDIGSNEGEMRARLLLKRAKKEYDENLDRAREASQIASQLLDSYRTNKAFSSEDGKKLERMEKIARRIRNEAGGSESDVAVEVPPAMEPAVKCMAELAEDLRKEVEKTPRHVVSAAVIDQANKLLGSIHHVRNPGH